MTDDELKAWKVQKKTEAYELFEKGDPTGSFNQAIYHAKLKAIDEIL